MPDAPPTAPRSPLFWRRAALAPFCLALVAGLHVWRVQAHHQSAWKGGGFGMFSTVDSPHARFVRAALLTPAGSLPLAVPPRWEKIASELRTAPSQAGVDELAELLAAQAFRDDRARWAALAGRLDEAGATNVTRDVLHAPPPVPLVSAPPGAATELIALGRGEEATADPARVPLTGVEVVLWRYRFDHVTKQLRAEPWFSARQLAE